jgi:hypothetical protein
VRQLTIHHHKRRDITSVATQRIRPAADAVFDREDSARRTRESIAGRRAVLRGLPFTAARAAQR